jgi:putative ABC transport system permease protein
MMALVQYAARGILRRPWQTLSYLLGLLLAVGLFADTLFFVDLSQRDMTRNALAPVQVDMIARATTPELSSSQLESTLKNQALVRSAVGVASADFASVTKLGGGILSATGKIFALPERYYQQFNFLPIVDGRFDPQGAMIGDATATQLGLKVGDTISVRFAAGVTQPYQLQVSGIVGMGASEPMFFNPDPAGGEGYGVVADVVFVSPELFERDLSPALAKLPVTTSSVGQTGSSVILLPIERQVHLKVNRSSLNADPTKAALELDTLRRTLERPFPGQVRVQDNLGKKLFNAKKDILAAKMLFIFLALPGVLLAAYLSKYAVELSSDQRRRELGLLRVRGAGAQEVLLVTLFTALMVAALGIVLGLAFGAVVMGVTMGWNIFNGTNLALVAPSVAWATLGGLGLTALAFFLPTWAQLRAEISGARRTVSRHASVPLWRTMGLDFVLLIAASIVLYITNANGGFQPTGTEGTAVTLSFYLFLAPFMFWIGGTLLLVRLLELLLTKGASWVTRALEVLFGDLGRVAAKGMSRRSGSVGAAVTLTALALSFGVALSLFLGTYEVQKQNDIRYVVGSDIRVTPPASANLKPDFAQRLSSLNGVSSVSSLARDAVALIGSEKKSVYGIDVPTFAASAFLPDTMFENGSAARSLEALRTTPNGVLVARDQADKFTINVGDPVLMRLYNPRTAKYTQVQTKAVGIFTYLSTSSQDSDFVLNRDFMTRSAGTLGADLFLVKTSDPSQVSTAIQQQFGDSVTLKLENTLTATKIDESSLTSLNLAGLGGLERLYTALIVASSLGVFLISMLQVRRKEFGTMRSLGTDEGQLRKLLAAEALSISSVSLASGIAIGIGIALLFVMLLRVIFLIPPGGLALPTSDLAVLFALSLGGMALGVMLTQRALSKLQVNEILREAQ